MRDDASPERMELFYRRHSAAIKGYVLRHFGSGPPDPDDVLQIVFESFAKVSASTLIDNPAAFLKRCARNYILDQRRRYAVRRVYEQDVLATSATTDDLDAQHVLEMKETLSAVEAAIAGLDARSREMLLMNRLHGLSSAEIARRFGCSPTLVKSIVARALVACHRALSEAE